MSLGNLKTEGQKGFNHPWQRKMLNVLNQIDGNTDLMEFLLSSILTTLQAQTDYEARFVLETCPGPATRVLLEVRVWDQDSGTWGPIKYYLPGSSVETPIGVGCTIEYTDPSSFLAQILAELQLQTPILTAIEVDTTNTVNELTDINTTLASILADTTIISNIDFATETTLNLALTTLGSILAQLDVDLSTRASEVTAGQINSNVQLGNITLNNLLTAFNAEDFATETTLAAINTKLTPALRTHNTISAVGVGSVPAGSLSGSMLNAGNAAGIWNGASIPAGVSIPWAPIANRDTYGAIAYDATGTTFIIEYTT
jgi:hypothetical protein